MKRPLFYILTLLVLFSGCAKVTTPTGGSKDTTPPKILKQQPEDQSINFSTNTIRITMDEYFTLNNPNDNVLISPPMMTKPAFEIKGKTLIIKIKDTLRDNTTYNILFSNCVQDFNEGNKLSMLQYSFSTGDAIDSCTLSGSVVDAKNGQSIEDMFVMLYESDEDSLPLTTLPYYVTKTKQDGRFVFRNIAPGRYKIFSLKDINSNYIYDLPNETIAFLDSVVAVEPDPAKDSLGHFIDSNYRAPDIRMTAFVVRDSVPKLQRYENPAPGVYKFPYSTGVEEFTAESTLPYFQTMNGTKDTVTWYCKTVPTDTVPCILTADGQRDTVNLKPFKGKMATGGRGGNAISTGNATRLKVSFANVGHFYKPLTLVFSYPVMPCDSFPIRVITSSHDTLTVYQSIPDTFVTELPLTLNIKDKRGYSLFLSDSIFHAYNGAYNDSLRIAVTPKTERDYGSITMHYMLNDSVHSYLVQLWNGKKMVQEDSIRNSSAISYEHLEPGSYSVIAIRDDNGNGRWDTGDYRKKNQPETIFNNAKTLTLRAYWDIEETFEIDNVSKLSPPEVPSGRR